MASVEVKKRKFRDLVNDHVIQCEGGTKCCISTTPCKYTQIKFDAGNFVRHFRTEHPTLAKAKGYFKDDAVVVEKSRCAKKRLIAIDQKTVSAACVQLVTVHNMPLMGIEWKAMKMLLDPFSDSLGVKFNTQNTKKLAATAARLQKK